MRVGAVRHVVKDQLDLVGAGRAGASVKFCTLVVTFAAKSTCLSVTRLAAGRTLPNDQVVGVVTELVGGIARAPDQAIGYSHGPRRRRGPPDRRHGGSVLAQDRPAAAVWGMPRAVPKRGSPGQ